MTETERLRHDEDWRRRLNRAVREFSSAMVGIDPNAVATLVNTMLREMGEILAVDCCSLIECADSEEEPSTGYHWCRSVPAVEGRPFEAPAFGSLVQQLESEPRPLILHSTATDDSDEPAIADACAYLRQTPIRTAVIIPIDVGNGPTWAWIFGALQPGQLWGDSLIEHLQVLGDIVLAALFRRRRDLEPAEAAGVNALPTKGRAAPAIRSQFPSNRGFEEIIGDGPALRSALALMEEVIGSESSVLLLGETGTGKELFARALHARGPRRAYPLVSVNCAALPPTLIESELFGHQRGAFTGAVALRQGRFEMAHRGTLFLDEIGDLPLELQPKLLRVLQEGAFERVGSSQTHAVDVRIIAATHQDLAHAVAAGEFRADLYYRLNVFPIRLPPLRERREDIPALVWAIIRKRQRALQRHIQRVPDEVLEALMQHSWPGNIRELENVIERALIHSTGDTLMLRAGSLEVSEVPAAGAGVTLMSVERAHIEEVLRDCGWRINGIGNAAERLGLHPNTLRFRMKKLGIVRTPSARDTRRLREREPEASGRAS